MFKHILFPTDGSEASRDAIRKCVLFAKETGASLTGIHVIPEFHIVTYHTEMLEDTKAQFERDCLLHAQHYLNEIKDIAKEYNVSCETSYLTGDHPFDVIVKQAQEKNCDLIAMASHGRRGLKGFLMGSETQKVITHSTVPVLVFR
ncbi:MAG: universal stress protein [Undibacterium umbellatum]|uniref:universal stress protein n=1 Tax=Undibacterium umbellatum TaxID=2762300 RepID=UPI003BB6AED8